MCSGGENGKYLLELAGPFSFFSFFELSFQMQHNFLSNCCNITFVHQICNINCSLVKCVQVEKMENIYWN